MAANKVSDGSGQVPLLQLFDFGATSALRIVNDWPADVANPSRGLRLVHPDSDHSDQICGELPAVVAGRLPLPPDNVCDRIRSLITNENLLAGYNVDYIARCATAGLKANPSSRAEGLKLNATDLVHLQTFVSGEAPSGLGPLRRECAEALLLGAAGGVSLTGFERSASLLLDTQRSLRQQGKAELPESSGKALLELMLTKSQSIGREAIEEILTRAFRNWRARGDIASHNGHLGLEQSTPGAEIDVYSLVSLSRTGERIARALVHAVDGSNQDRKELHPNELNLRRAIEIALPLAGLDGFSIQTLQNRNFGNETKWVLQCQSTQ